MGIDDGRIVLNNDTDIYYAGQTVFGKLIFRERKERGCRGIYVKLKGVCKVEFTERYGRTRMEYVSNEEYVNQKTYLIGSESGKETLSPGCHEYPFCFVIPSNCPSSFEGKYGHIRYQIKAVMDRAYKFNEEKTKIIKVIAPLDLNLVPGVKHPVEIKFDETYSCCFFYSGSVTAVVTLPYTGFVPGQHIPITIRTVHDGGVNVESLSMTIERNTTFHGKCGWFEDSRSVTEYVASLSLGDVLANTTSTTTLPVLLPQFDTANLDSCRYIKVGYKLQVSLTPDGCHFGNTQSQDIVFGTIPFIWSSHQEPQPNSPIVNQPSTSNYPGGNSLHDGGDTSHPIAPPY